MTGLSGFGSAEVDRCRQYTGEAEEMYSVYSTASHGVSMCRLQVSVMTVKWVAA